MSVRLNWKTKGSGQTKISKLDVLAICVNQQVLRLQISVENSMLVQIDERLEDLVEEELGLLLGQRLIALLFHVLLEIELEIFEDEVKLILAVDDLLKFYNVWVSESLEKTDFSDRS